MCRRRRASTGEAHPWFEGDNLFVFLEMMNEFDLLHSLKKHINQYCSRIKCWHFYVSENQTNIKTDACHFYNTCMYMTWFTWQEVEGIVVVLRLGRSWQIYRPLFKPVFQCLSVGPQCF